MIFRTLVAAFMLCAVLFAPAHGAAVQATAPRGVSVHVGGRVARVIADVDGDLSPDELSVVRGLDAVQIRVRLSGRRPERRLEFPARRGSTLGLTLTDVDGDGARDILVFGGGPVELWRNDGGGAFRAAPRGPDESMTRTARAQAAPRPVAGVPPTRAGRLAARPGGTPHDGGARRHPAPVRDFLRVATVTLESGPRGPPTCAAR